MLVESLLKNVEFKALGKKDVEIDSLSYNTANVKDGALFFCIPGFKHDGHDFAYDAIKKGARALVVERHLDLDIEQYLVQDCRRALASASAVFFGEPSDRFDLVGVTGTNGKTTTTFLVDWVANELGYKTGLIGTVETRVGQKKIHADHTTPESLELQSLLAQMRDEGCKEVSMEVSSHAIDLKRVFGTHFAVVAFSNLTQDHLDYHKTMEAYFDAKASFFDRLYSNKAAICIDDEYGKRLAQIAKDRSLEVLTCGFSESADISVFNVQYLPTHTDLVISTPQGFFEIDYQLIGAFNVSNMLLAFSICLSLGYPADKIAKALESAKAAPGRLERVSLPNSTPKKTHEFFGFSVFVDYAHTPDSISKAIDALRPITKGRLIIVFGCGGDRDATKRPKMGAAACSADYLVVTSDNPRSEDPDAIIRDIVPGLCNAEGRYCIEADRRKAIQIALEMAKADDNILIAGKGHEDYQLVGDKVLHFDDREVAQEILIDLKQRQN